jgi:hypothetical protein
MTFCGFNDKMLEGLRAFSEGAVEHGLIDRSRQNGETLEHALSRELADMSRLRIELDTLNDPVKRLMTKGLLDYTVGVYLAVRRNGVNQIPTTYCDTIVRIVGYLKAMDDKYYKELKNRPDDMGELVVFLNRQSILRE